MCRNNSCLIALTLGGFVGIILAALVYAGIFTNVVPFLYVTLAIGIISILYLINSLNSCCKNLICIRNNILCLLIGSIGIILASIIALSVNLTTGELLSAFLIGIISLFLTLVLITIITLIFCIINSLDDTVSNDTEVSLANEEGIEDMYNNGTNNIGNYNNGNNNVGNFNRGNNNFGNNNVGNNNYGDNNRGNNNVGNNNLGCRCRSRN